MADELLLAPARDAEIFYSSTLSMAVASGPVSAGPVSVLAISRLRMRR